MAGQMLFCTAPPSSCADRRDMSSTGTSTATSIVFSLPALTIATSLGPPRNRATSSNGRCVAESPIRCGSALVSAHSRSRLSARCDPRLVAATEWISSTISQRTDASIRRAALVRSRNSDSGVVIRMSGGCRSIDRLNIVAGWDERARLGVLMGGFAVTQMLYVAARLNLADHLAHGPLTYKQLAAECGARPDPLRRVVSALAGTGVFEIGEDGRVGNTLMSALLRSSAPDSLRPLALLYGEEHYHAMAELLSAVRRGGTAFEHAYRKSHYSYLASNADAARAYHGAVNAETTRSAEAAVRAYDFAGAEMVVDVGGRGRSLIRAALRPNRGPGGGRRVRRQHHRRSESRAVTAPARASAAGAA